MAKKEIETILYWKGEMEKILAKRPESLGTLQLQMQNFTQRMQNRIKILKNSLPKWKSKKCKEIFLENGSFLIFGLLYENWANIPKSKSMPIWIFLEK